MLAGRGVGRFACGVSDESSPEPRSVLNSILLGGLIGGTCDITYAVGFSAWRGVAPMRILQSVASGLLGKPAFEGGVPTAALGLGLHYVIALIWAAIYVLASRRLNVLRERAAVCGVIYGALIFATMNLVVLPLSALPGKPSTVPIVVITGLIVHMFGLGLPIALVARRMTRA